MSESPTFSSATARAIHASGIQLAIAVTGGGSGAICELMQTPGASRTVLEAIVPYSHAALADWLGGMPDQACSEGAARAMAMAAYMRARRLAPEAADGTLRGVGFTGSLATDRPKRGARRFHLAVQSDDRTEVHSIVLGGTVAERQRDEQRATAWLVWLVARSAGVAVEAPAGDEGDQHTERSETAPARWSELLVGRREVVFENAGQRRDDAVEGAAVFPGAFNPPHTGHCRMAEVAEQRLARPVMWELSIVNVDKPPLDFISMAERVAALATAAPGRGVALTRAPTFVEKSMLFPGATFVTGADTIARIAEVRYYAGSELARDEAIATIAGQRCRFLVFGRKLASGFTGLSELTLPAKLAAICDEVSAGEFREDVSSTELRRQSGGE